jgi:regulator of protease activity HflC (stomatin/prohibitin superfamily)
VYRFRTDHIQSVNIGSAPEDEDHAERTVLWTVSHSKEENFIVANREKEPSGGAGTGSSKRTPPVSFLTGTVPVQYQITNLLAWVYNNDDAGELLRYLASREVVRFLVAADMNEVMSDGRLEASDALAARIQGAADRSGLGVRIVAANLGDMHPPVKVAQDYENVVSALQRKEARILAARADDIRTNALAGAKAADVLNRAQADALGRTNLAFAQAALFAHQIPAFQSAPSVYAQRAYLQTFVRGTANARKYIILTTNTHDVLTFDLQTKIREDLLNLNVTPKK